MIQKHCQLQPTATIHLQGRRHPVHGKFPFWSANSCEEYTPRNQSPLITIHLPLRPQTVSEYSRSKPLQHNETGFPPPGLLLIERSLHVGLPRFL